MIEEKNICVQKKLEDYDLVHRETGQLAKLDKGESVILKKKKDTFVMNYDNYVSFTPQAIEYLIVNCKKADIAKVLSISSTLKTEFCISYLDNNIPHNANSLCSFLDMTQDEFYRLVKRLVTKGVLAYTVCAPTGHVQKIFMLNPYIAKKRNEISNELKVMFRDITKDVPTSINTELGESSNTIKKIKQ
jgi:hypothetical protein